jgi:curved DNA-binding protein CbpA
MTPAEALDLLGLRADTTWTEIRARYRTQIRSWHPDVHGDTPKTHAVTAQLNAAFTILEPIYRRGEGVRPIVRNPTDVADAGDDGDASDGSDGADGSDTIDLAALDDDGLTLVAPADEVFLRLHHALDRLGDVTYADPEAGYLEALVQPSGYGPAQLAVSLQGRAHGTEVWFTLESLGPHQGAPIADVVRLVARMVRQGGVG